MINNGNDNSFQCSLENLFLVPKHFLQIECILGNWNLETVGQNHHKRINIIYHLFLNLLFKILLSCFSYSRVLWGK